MDKKRASILVVDDMELNRAILCELFQNDYDVLEAENGVQAIELIERHDSEIAVVLLDLVMPIMGGMDVLRIMSQRHWIDHIPVIMISADSSVDSTLQGYSLGVTDFISKPFNPEIVRQRIGNTIELFQHRLRLESLLERQAARLKKTTSFVIDALSTAVEFRSGESGLHIRRVRGITRIMLTAMAGMYPQYNINQEFVDTVSEASAMHDIGKIAIPDSILLKPGKLTTEEFEIMKTHTTQGCKLLENLRYTQDDIFYDQCYAICRHHHERWDGSGYPDGLAGNKIPMAAQVVSIADVYDALTSDRVYKKAFSHEKSVEMILNGECGVFNPQLLACFRDIQESLREQSQVIQEKEPERIGVPHIYNVSNGRITRARIRSSSVMTRERSLRLLEREREKYRILSELAGEVVFDYSHASNTISFSEKFSEVFGGENKIPHFRRWLKSADVVYYQDRPKLIGLYKALTPDSPSGKTEIRLRLHNGVYEWFELKVYSMWREEDPGQPEGLIGKITNINHQKLELARLSERADQDVLTGIMNRCALERMINQSLLQESPKCALMMLDADNFKLVNDQYGHGAGDRLLCCIAKKLERLCYPADFVGRVGGDEFIVFFTHINSPEIAAEKAQAVCRVFHEAARSVAPGFTISGSVGIAVCPTDGEDFNTLRDKADRALYSAKQHGKDRYVFYSPAMTSVAKTV